MIFRFYIGKNRSLSAHLSSLLEVLVHSQVDSPQEAALSRQVLQILNESLLQYEVCLQSGSIAVILLLDIVILYYILHSLF